MFFEKFFNKTPTKPSNANERAYVPKKEPTLEVVNSSIIENESELPLQDLIHSQGFNNVDSRINQENFPSKERMKVFNANPHFTARDASLEDVEKDFNSIGRKSASVYELLEYLKNGDSKYNNIYALDSFLMDGDDKFVVVYRKDNDIKTLELEHCPAAGKGECYAPWTGVWLSVKRIL